MKKRIALVVLLACGLAATSLLTGCASWGNGQLDLPVEIEVVYVDNFGNAYNLVAGPDGIDGSVAYVSASGNIYELSEDGFAVTAPDGTKIRIKRVAPGTKNPSPNASPQIDQASPST